jgi:hypothetical protein
MGPSWQAFFPSRKRKRRIARRLHFRLGKKRHDPALGKSSPVVRMEPRKLPEFPCDQGENRLSLRAGDGREKRNDIVIY